MLTQRKISKSSVISNISCSSLFSSGLKRNSFSDVAKNIAMISEKELAEVSNISQRSISRLKPDDLLPDHTAEVIISIMRTYHRALEVFEDEDTAHKWLKTPLQVLNNKMPLQAVSNRFGAELVLDVLGRIEHGIFS